MSRTAAIYARISLDRREGEGVARQLADCRKLAAERGWEVGEEFVDNDLSAFRAKRRPEWDRLLQALEDETVNALIAYHPDRTYRRTADLEQLIDVVERTGAEIATVKAGDIDLATATGRMAARIVAAVSRHESERIGERVSRAKRERAAQGRPPGGGKRAFGWKVDKLALEPREARALRTVALRVAAGKSIGEQVRWLNDRGHLTTEGRPWTVGVLRRALENPRIAGLRSYHGDIMGPAAWEPIVDEETWRRIVLFCEPRKGRPRGEQTLLSALIACPKCGRRLYITAGQYRCAPGTRQGCGGSSIQQTHADAAVIAAVEAELMQASTSDWVTDRPTPDLAEEAAAIEQRRIALTRRWAAGTITDAEYDAGRQVLTDRLEHLEAPVEIPRIDLATLRAAWSTADIPERRAVIEAIVDLPIGLASGRVADPRDRITVEFR